MKKILKLTAMALGALAMVFGLNSCSKDDDNGPECCSFSESGTTNGVAYSYSGEICEDGTYEASYTYGDDTYSYSGNWMDEDDDVTWAEIKEDYC